MSGEDTASVSKGVFVFKNGFKPNKTHSTSKDNDPFMANLWYQEYRALWSALNREYKRISVEMFASTTAELLNYVGNSHNEVLNEIPTAALLTGINMPDHNAQFKGLHDLVRNHISPHVAFLTTEECSSLKYLMETMILQLMGEPDMKKAQISFALLNSWYQDLYKTNVEKLLVVIIPNFEGCCPKLLQGFIQVVHSYLGQLPFVFIFGVATSVETLYKNLPYHVISKININVFKCEPSAVHLNNVLEELFLTPYCPFQLGGKVFDLFTEIFLFYDFSVRNFVQNIKFAMMEHFSHGNAMALCQIGKKEVKSILNIFTPDDCENMRQLPSFRTLVESETYENQIKLFNNQEYFKKVAYEKIVLIQKYIKRFHVFLKCLHVLVDELPELPLGQNLREVYTIAVTKPLTTSKEYKEAFQLLGFQSMGDLRSKLYNIKKVMEKYVNVDSKKTQLKDFCLEVDRYHTLIDNLIKNPEVDNEVIQKSDNSSLKGVTDRKALKKALLSRSKQCSNSVRKFENVREEILTFLSSNFETYLAHPSSFHFYEIFFFEDISIKDKIIGTHRSAIHNALRNPHYYLQCKCCQIFNAQTIKATMPDICIVYKLHLEWGKMINLYDWLCAFLCVVDSKHEDEGDGESKKVVDPQLQARFTQAVTEMEYLGFIKSSKRKADHVMRLTWEG